MKNIQEQDWATQVALLIELIKRDNDALKRHIFANSPSVLIEQYQELRGVHLSKLQVLLKNTGMSIELLPLITPQAA